MLNPGYFYGAPRGIAVGNFLQQALTGKTGNATKSITRKYLGRPYYDNIRPVGYGNVEGNATPRNTQVRNMIIDFFKPRFLRNNVSNPDYKPKWLIDRNNPTSDEIFRNDAHRLSMGLKAHQELLPDGKRHSLYIKQSDGTYDADWDYIDFVKKKYPEGNIPMHTVAFPDNIEYVGNPSSGHVVSGDWITHNGGYGTYIFNPQKLKTVKPAKGFPTHYSVGDVTFIDTWDIQPLLDKRSFVPWLTKKATLVENKNIPVLSKVAHNIKNTELVNSFGGVPFTQKSKLPDKTIRWFRSNTTPEQLIDEYKAAGEPFETLNL